MSGWRSKSTQRTLAYTLSALILYIPALLFPFMTMEINGIKTSSTIWQGIVTLSHSGSYFVAGIVLLASIVIPILKLSILFYLSLTQNKHARIKLALYRFVENIGRWSMLDIFLLAVMVAIIKISPWALVYPEQGSFLFALVVVFTMLASASFDPRLMWKEGYGKKIEL
jgi:paraquat-inducible protein A